MRHCYNKNCQKVNPQSLDNFHKRPNSRDGYDTRCKDCINRRSREYNKNYIKLPKIKQKRRNDRLKKDFNISIDEYNKLFDKQNGCCDICKKHQSEFKIALNVDHDHKTGEIRGLLCSGCNRGLGFFLDNCTILDNAKIYLNKPKLKIIKENA